MKAILLVKKLLGLVEMKPGLVNASFSLPKWQTVEMSFLAPCLAYFFLCFWFTIMCDKRFQTKEIKFKPRIQFNQNRENRYTVLAIVVH